MTLPSTGPRAPSRDPVEPPAADVLLSDGTVALVRPVVAADRPALERLHEAASPDSLRLRFFASSKRAGLDYVAHLFDEPSPGSPAGAVAALVLLLDGRVVALATAERVDDRTAE